MAKSNKVQLVRAKRETVTGTDAAPSSATNAILVRSQSCEPIVGDQVARNLIRPYKGNGGKLFAGEYRRWTGEVELAGAGVAGDEPAWGLLLEACGFAVTETPGTDVQYDPVSDGEPTLTIYSELDGTRFALLGAKGTVKFALAAKGIPVMQFEFIGAYVPATEVPVPTDVDYSKFLQPKTVGKVNTPNFTLHGLTAPTSSFNIDWAAALNWRDLINYRGAQSPDRTPTATAVLDLPRVDTKDWAEALRNSTGGAFTLVHGLNAGNIIELQGPSLVPTAFSISDDNSTAQANLTFDVNPVDGNDELRIIVR